MDDPVDHEEAEDVDGQHEEVHGERIGQADDAEKPPPRHRLDAVLAAGERHMARDEIDHLGHGQRHHGVVDALAAYSQDYANESAQLARRVSPENEEPSG